MKNKFEIYYQKLATLGVNNCVNSIVNVFKFWPKVSKNLTKNEDILK